MPESLDYLPLPERLPEGHWSLDYNPNTQKIAMVLRSGRPAHFGGGIFRTEYRRYTFTHLQSRESLIQYAEEASRWVDTALSVGVNFPEEFTTTGFI